MRRKAEALPVADLDEGRPAERLEPAAQVEERMTRLFRRWPALSDVENSELLRLWRQRVNRAKRRAQRRSGDVPDSGQ
jgi:hypothetical protein